MSKFIYVSTYLLVTIHVYICIRGLEAASCWVPSIPGGSLEDSPVFLRARQRPSGVYCWEERGALCATSLEVVRPGFQEPSLSLIVAVLELDRVASYVRLVMVRICLALLVGGRS